MHHWRRRSEGGTRQAASAPQTACIGVSASGVAKSTRLALGLLDVGLRSLAAADAAATLTDDAVGSPPVKLRLSVWPGAIVYGKKFFKHAPFEMSDSFHVGMIGPVVHYTMGGVEANDKSEVLHGATKRVIPGVFAAGEVMGGVHGKNRLGGNSLLDCVVYGRVAGRRAAKYLLEQHLAAPNRGVAAGAAAASGGGAVTGAGAPPSTMLSSHTAVVGGATTLYLTQGGIHTAITIAPGQTSALALWVATPPRRPRVWRPPTTAGRHRASPTPSASTLPRPKRTRRCTPSAAHSRPASSHPLTCAASDVRYRWPVSSHAARGKRRAHAIVDGQRGRNDGEGGYMVTFLRVSLVWLFWFSASVRREDESRHTTRCATHVWRGSTCEFETYSPALGA